MSAPAIEPREACSLWEYAAGIFWLIYVWEEVWLLVYGAAVSELAFAAAALSAGSLGAVYHIARRRSGSRPTARRRASLLATAYAFGFVPLLVFLPPPVTP